MEVAKEVMNFSCESYLFLGPGNKKEKKLCILVL